LFKKITDRIETNRILKDIEKAAYIEEKTKVDVENKKTAEIKAIERGKAKARGDKNKSRSEFSNKLNAWADRKSAEMKEQQKNEGEFKLPDGYKQTW